MKNLIKAIEAEQKKNLTDFINSINEVESLDGLKSWYYTDLLPKGKDISTFSLAQLKAYLITRKEKQVYKAIERKVKQINDISNCGTFTYAKINVEWKSSRTWGANPSAVCAYSFINNDGNADSNRTQSGSISGCGYDKLSTAVADCLNQIPQIKKLLYSLKNDNIGINNRELFGYGAGYGITPNIEGGVGVSCYNAIFNKIGFEFKQIASGKMFDCFEITKLTNK